MSSIGTDGQIPEYVLGGYADYVAGDATSAYTTFSPLNNPGVPYPASDWSWGYQGANPVIKATRRVITVHDPSTRPYFIILDDIDKDGTVHNYEWRMHTVDSSTIDTSTDPIRVSTGNAYLDVHALHPMFDSLATSVTFFDNETEDADSRYLSLVTDAVNPDFAFLLFPGDGSFSPPVISVSRLVYGVFASVVWGGGRNDFLLINMSGQPIGTTVQTTTGVAAGGMSSAGLLTDASVVVLAMNGTQVEQYLVTNATYLTLDGVELVSVSDGPVNISKSLDRIDIDRPGADFRLFAPGISEVFYRDQRIFVVESGGYLMPSPVTGIDDIPQPTPRAKITAHPNPFNPSTQITIDLKVRSVVTAQIFDVTGRRVRNLWEGPLGAGVSAIEWDGRDGRGQRVASGVYLLRVNTGGNVRTLKLTLLK